MKNFFNKVMATSIVASIVFIAVGVFLFMNPGKTISIISYLLGGIILLLGAFGLFRFFGEKENKKIYTVDLIYGVLSFVAGLILILNPTSLAIVIQYVVAFWIIMNSSLKIKYAYNFKNFNSKAWIITLVVSLVSLICGIVLIFYPFEGALFVTKMIGIFLIVYSVLDIIDSIIIQVNTKKFLKENSIVVVEKEIK